MLEADRSIGIGGHVLGIQFDKLAVASPVDKDGLGIECVRVERSDGECLGLPLVDGAGIGDCGGRRDLGRGDAESIFCSLAIVGNDSDPNYASQLWSSGQQQAGPIEDGFRLGHLGIGQFPQPQPVVGWRPGAQAQVSHRLSRIQASSSVNIGYQLPGYTDRKPSCG